MKECVKEAIDRFICRLKEVSTFFEVVEEGGKNFSLFIEDKECFKYKVICIENMFNIDYKKHVPVMQDGKFSKWTPSLLNIMAIISDINNALLKCSASCIEVIEYILSKENSIYFSDIDNGGYLYAN